MPYRHAIHSILLQSNMILSAMVSSLSSGAIRNHQPEVMYEAFRIVGYAKDVVEEKFGHMIAAFRFGAPPHGGIAPGIDRLVRLYADEPNLREVIMFPMNQQAQELMVGSPAPVSSQQLEELHLRITAPCTD